MTSFPALPRCRLQVVDGGKDIRWQTVDPAELHHGSLRPAAPRSEPPHLNLHRHRHPHRGSHVHLCCRAHPRRFPPSSWPRPPAHRGRPATRRWPRWHRHAPPPPRCRRVLRWTKAAGRPSFDFHRLGPWARATTNAGSASHRLRATRRRAFRWCGPWAAGNPHGQALHPQRPGHLHHLLPAFGRRGKGDAVGPVLRLAQAVAGPEGGHDAAGGRVWPTAVNCASNTSLPGTSPTRATSVPKYGPPPGVAGVGPPGHQCAENGERSQRRSVGLAHGPDVVVTEHPVDTGGKRLRRRLRASSGLSRKVGSTTPVADHHKPPRRAADRAAHSAGPLAEGGGHDDHRLTGGPALDQ